MLTTLLLGTIACSSVESAPVPAVAEPSLMAAHNAAVLLCSKNHNTAWTLELVHLGSEKLVSDQKRQNAVGEIKASRVWAINAVGQNENMAQYMHWFKTQMTTETWVFTTDLAEGSVIKASDIKRQRVSVPAVDQLLEVDPTGLLLTKAVRKNAIVDKKWLREMPLIRSKQPLTLRVKSDGLVIQTGAVAVTEAKAAGDALRIRVNASQQIITAIAEDRNHVFVE